MIKQYIKYQIRSSNQEIQEITSTINEEHAMYHVHKACMRQLYEQRQGNANCKTRSEVRGGGKKPWKQKGTGRARAGSIRSPLWRGGGVIFGPKTKNYKLKINKKERILAINNLLYNKKDSILTIPSSLLIFDTPKTDSFLKVLEKLQISRTTKVLLVMVTKYKNTYLATRNLKKLELISAHQLNLLSIIKAEKILIEKDAIDIINKINYEEKL